MCAMALHTSRIRAKSVAAKGLGPRACGHAGTGTQARKQCQLHRCIGGRAPAGAQPAHHQLPPLPSHCLRQPCAGGAQPAQQASSSFSRSLEFAPDGGEQPEGRHGRPDEDGHRVGSRHSRNWVLSKTRFYHIRHMARTGKNIWTGNIYFLMVCPL